MSKEFRDKYQGKKYTRKDVQHFTDFYTEPGPDGRPVYVTEQGHKDECDVNNIIKKYDATGLITHVANFEASYGDVGSLDFREALELQMQISEKFSELPSSIRKTFENSPQKYLEFLENPKNYDQSVEMGLRKPPVTPNVAPQPSKLQKATKEAIDDIKKL
jgi:phage internal scaffolding protein